jgi:hypothetical protein
MAGETQLIRAIPDRQVPSLADAAPLTLSVISLAWLWGTSCRWFEFLFLSEHGVHASTAASHDVPDRRIAASSGHGRQ